LEERDVQLRGYPVRFPLDVLLVFSANPEDYTNRGRIITPLKDRYGAQIHTHYPRNVDSEIAIMEQEWTRFDEESGHPGVVVPPYMKEIVAEITRLARRSPDINQRSGVSVRASITDYESLLADAFRRALRLKERKAVPRISDLPYLLPSISGKLEFETVEEGRDEQIIEKFVQGAVLAVFNRYFSLGELEPVVARFKEGFAMEVGDSQPSAEYARMAKKVDGLPQAVEKLGGAGKPGLTAAAVEFLLEGLHLNKRLNKDKMTGKAQYRG
jgi:magnesium chelatase subunit I